MCVERNPNIYFIPNINLAALVSQQQPTLELLRLFSVLIFLSLRSIRCRLTSELQATSFRLRFFWEPFLDSLWKSCGLSAESTDMKIQPLKFCEQLLKFCSEVKITSVVVILVALYFLLAVLWHRLLSKSRKDHEFGESLLCETEPKLKKIKIVWKPRVKKPKETVKNICEDLNHRLCVGFRSGRTGSTMICLENKRLTWHIRMISHDRNISSSESGEISFECSGKSIKKWKFEIEKLKNFLLFLDIFCSCGCWWQVMSHRHLQRI